MEILDVDVFQKFLEVLKVTTILAPENGDNIEWNGFLSHGFLSHSILDIAKVSAEV